MKRFAVIAVFAVTLIVASNAHALAPVANWSMGGGNPYWNDYDIYLGVYSPADNSTVLWSTRLAYSHNSSDGDPSGGVVGLGSVDEYVSGHRWYLLVDDNWGGNASYIQSFNVVTDQGTFGAAGLPIYVPDYAARYAYVDVPALDDNNDDEPNAIPEPASMMLFGFGAAGAAFIRRKKA